MPHHFSALGSLVRIAMLAMRRQAIYLAVTLAVAIAAWFVLAAVAAPYTGGTGGKEAGVTIRNASQGNAPLPLRYGKRLVQVRGAEDVTWITLQMVQCGSQSKPVTINAYGGPGAAHALTAEQDIDPAVVKRWLDDPLGIIVSEKTLHDCGWRVGQGVTPSTMIGTTTPLALHISGTFHDRSAGYIGVAHFDYINHNHPLMGEDKVIAYRAHAADPQHDELLAARIEQAFAHDFPTVRATTNTTAQNAWARFGKVQQLLALVMAAIFLCTASVLVSVLAHAAALQRRQFALLEVFGFGRRTLFVVFAVQALLILLVGAGLGIAAGLWAHHLIAGTRMGVLAGGFQIPDWAWHWLPAWLALLWLASLGWPASIIRRVRPTDTKAV